VKGRRREKDDRAALTELYKLALDEYHFQVNLNWSRSQYYLTLNIGILGVGTGILQFAHGVFGFLVSGIFLAGTTCCLLSFAASLVQQRYYEQTRLHKANIESKLDLGELRIKTTPGMGSTVKRLGKVKTFLSVMLIVIGTIDTLGIVAGILIGTGTIR